MIDNYIGGCICNGRKRWCVCNFAFANNLASIASEHNKKIQSLKILDYYRDIRVTHNF